MLDIIMNILLSVVSYASGAVLNVGTMQRVFFFVTSVLSSENAAVTVVPMAVGTALFGTSAVTFIRRFFYPRDGNNSNNGGRSAGFFSLQGLSWAFLGASFCVFLRWPVTMLIMAVLFGGQFHLNWIPQELGWKLVAQGVLTWILSAVIARYTTETLSSCYRKLTSWIVAAVKGLVVGVFRSIYNTVTWPFRRLPALLFSSRAAANTTEEGEVELEVDVPSFFIADRRLTYDMDDFVYDSDYEVDSENDGGYDSGDYDLDDDESEEVHQKNIVTAFVSTLRRSARLANAPRPCYTSGRVDYSMSRGY
jgi:hypothetical protein